MKLQITGVERSTSDSITLHFKRDDGMPSYKPGQHALLSFSFDNQTYTRSYSFHTSPYVDTDCAITIRAIDGGQVSQYLISNTTPSFDIALHGVKGDFFLEPREGAERNVICFAGGSGITPIFSMVKTVLFREPHSRVTLVYANRSYDRIIFLTELESLCKIFGKRLTVHHVLSDGNSAPANFNTYYNGRLSRLIAKKMITQTTRESPMASELYVCGPIGFVDIIEQAARSVDETLPVAKELFYIPPSDAQAVMDLPERKVAIRILQKEMTVSAGRGKSILQAGLEQGVPLSYSCTQGHCGKCRAWLRQGKVKMAVNHALTESDLLDGLVLLCQSYPETDDVIVEQ